MPLTGRTRVAGVIGSPVRHSLSPRIMNAAFEAMGADWVYVAFEVPADHGAAAVQAMRCLDLGGLSVTMPHKETAARAVDVRTGVADALGAVNCVFWDSGRLVGDSTDGAGFLDGLQADAGVDPAGRRCAVIGAGGAGRAVAWALGQAKADDVAIVNRSSERAAHAVELAGPAGRLGGPPDIGSADLVVNATSLGMAEHDPLPLDPGLLHEGQVVVDLIYHPATTPLLAATAGAGATAVNGLGMLVHQAAHALRHWIGAPPPIAVMTEAAAADLDRRTRFDG